MGHDTVIAVAVMSTYDGAACPSGTSPSAAGTSIGAELMMNCRAAWIRSNTPEHAISTADVAAVAALLSLLSLLSLLGL
jgi:hypothetical protein